MKPRECPFEHSILDAVANGCWPGAIDADLREHTGVCDPCRDLVVSASAILEDRYAHESEVSVAPSGATWWRIQMRMKADARMAAARTVQRVHATIIAATLLVVFGVLSATSLPARLWNWMAGIVGDVSLDLTMSSLVIAVPPLAILALIIAPLVVMGPVALYLALAKE